MHSACLHSRRCLTFLTPDDLLADKNTNLLAYEVSLYCTATSLGAAIRVCSWVEFAAESKMTLKLHVSCVTAASTRWVWCQAKAKANATAGLQTWDCTPSVFPPILNKSRFLRCHSCQYLDGRVGLSHLFFFSLSFKFSHAFRSLLSSGARRVRRDSKVFILKQNYFKL